MAEPELGEVWRCVEGYPAYEVSSLGRVRRATRILRTSVTDGYLFVRPGHRAPRIQVHVLVLRAFHGPKPSPAHESRHLDGDRANNRADNLLWGTRAENVEDKYRHGTTPRGERHPKVTVSAAEVREIRAAYAAAKVGRGRYAPQGWRGVMAAKYGVSMSALKDILSGRSWGWLDDDGWRHRSSPSSRDRGGHP